MVTPFKPLDKTNPWRLPCKLWLFLPCCMHKVSCIVCCPCGNPDSCGVTLWTHLFRRDHFWTLASITTKALEGELMSVSVLLKFLKRILLHQLFVCFGRSGLHTQGCARASAVIWSGHQVLACSVRIQCFSGWHFDLLGYLDLPWLSFEGQDQSWPECVICIDNLFI